MSSPVEIRNSPSGKVLSAFGPLLIGAIFAFYMVKGLVNGADGGRVLLVALLALGCLGLGLYIARGALDRSVKVVFDAEGFRDRRAGDVLVPWHVVRSVRLASGKGSGILNFKLTEEPPDEIKYALDNLVSLMFGNNTVHMEVSSLDMPGPDMVAAIRRLAPHVTVER